jgi:pyruvate dehydrogenase complex dehydrogenase (E1) component
MMALTDGAAIDLDVVKTSERLEALDAAVANDGPDRARQRLTRVVERAQHAGTGPIATLNTDDVNTIPRRARSQAARGPRPGAAPAIDHPLNAMAMVVRANDRSHGIGGHIASYQSVATPYEVGFNQFWRGPDTSIYQARFMKYLQARGLANTEGRKVWFFVGDGEVDEPEPMGSAGLAGRERLDNLIWVVNCDLQGLDGPVRGNGKIIRELEWDFCGAGWNVIKVIWGSRWDPLLARTSIWMTAPSRPPAGVR